LKFRLRGCKMKVSVDHPCAHIISDQTPLKIWIPKSLPQKHFSQKSFPKFKTTPFFTRLGSDARSNFAHQISDHPKLGNLCPGNPKTAQRFKELFSINFRLEQKKFSYVRTLKRIFRKDQVTFSPDRPGIQHSSIRSNWRPTQTQLQNNTEHIQYRHPTRQSLEHRDTCTNIFSLANKTDIWFERNLNCKH
jgi:hypothetical protein